MKIVSEIAAASSQHLIGGISKEGKVKMSTVENETTNTEVDNILAGVRDDALGDKILKFKAEKGQYVIGDEVIELGTKYYAHVPGWLKIWTKFHDKQVVARKVFVVARKEEPPERKELDDLDMASWPKGPNGKSSDPWQYTYTLPLERVDDGDFIIFTTPTIGGRLAVRELCDKWVKQAQKEGQRNPIVELAITDMPSKNHEGGKVKRPDFRIIEWDAAGNASDVPNDFAAPTLVKQNGKAAVKHDDMDDEIPF